MGGIQWKFWEVLPNVADFSPSSTKNQEAFPWFRNKIRPRDYWQHFTGKCLTDAYQHQPHQLKPSSLCYTLLHRSALLGCNSFCCWGLLLICAVLSFTMACAELFLVAFLCLVTSKLLKKVKWSPGVHLWISLGKAVQSHAVWLSRSQSTSSCWAGAQLPPYLCIQSQLCKWKHQGLK